MCVAAFDFLQFSGLHSYWSVLGRSSVPGHHAPLVSTSPISYLWLPPNTKCDKYAYHVFYLKMRNTSNKRPLSRKMMKVTLNQCKRNGSLPAPFMPVVLVQTGSCQCRNLVCSLGSHFTKIEPSFNVEERDSG